MQLHSIIEANINFADKYNVYVTGYQDQPTLDIHKIGFVRLFASTNNWVFHMIRGETPGAGTILYFAGLYWALLESKKPQFSKTHGWVASDTSLSPDAIRTRNRMVTQYKDYLYIETHPEYEEIKIHSNDGSDIRRKAEKSEATMWRLKKAPPFEFEFIKHINESTSLASPIIRRIMYSPAAIHIQYPSGDIWEYVIYDNNTLMKLLRSHRKNIGRLVAVLRKNNYESSKIQ